MRTRGAMSGLINQRSSGWRGCRKCRSNFLPNRSPATHIWL